MPATTAVNLVTLHVSAGLVVVEEQEQAEPGWYYQEGEVVEGMEMDIRVGEVVVEGVEQRDASSVIGRVILLETALKRRRDVTTVTS